MNRSRRHEGAPKRIYVCSECGSDAVEVSIWWDPNRELVMGEVLDYAWCRGCDSETELEDATASEPETRGVRETPAAYGRENAVEPSDPGQRRLDVVAVREVALRYVGPALRGSRIEKAEHAVALARKCVKDDTKEHLIALYLDAGHRPIGHAIVSVGTATFSLAHPREIFQPGILLGAIAIVVLHNHPGGDPSPSKEDREVTRRLCDAGRLLGIPLLDHIVWARDGAFVSLREENELPFLGETRL